MNEQSLVDKTMRSVFVGNIPYDVTEERLKEIFGEVGPVVSFKLVFDRDSGKPKGYGFCEYKDQETALCAMRNLNNYEISGRNLRVDNACTEKSRLEMHALMQSAQIESSHGESVSPEKAPEVISRAVASLPPEQMYELIKQMKICIQSNPAEAREMLLQNPQLSYALLQVMVIMKIIDPLNALSMLHAPNTSSVKVSSTSTTTSSTPVNNVSTTSTDQNAVSSTDSKPMQPIQPITPWNNANNVKPMIPGPQNLGGIQPPPMPPIVPGQDFDLRAINRFADSDLRSLQMPGAFPPVDMFKRDPRLQQISDNMPPAFHGIVPPVGLLPPPNMPMPLPMPGPGMPVLPNMPRMVPPPISHPSRTPQTSMPSTVSNNTPSTTSVTNVSNVAPLLSAVGTDSEKANLIMRVLKLTDEEMALLPAEHRQSIFALKEQIAKSANKK